MLSLVEFIFPLSFCPGPQPTGYIAPVLEIVGGISDGAGGQEHAAWDDGILLRLARKLGANGFFVNVIVTHDGR